MNNGAINSFSINGATVPNWIVRAVGIVAVAAATVTATPTRVAVASAYGDAVAQVSLAPTQTIIARATATAGVSSYLAPHIVYAGKCTATALATGNGSVKRDFFAQAAGDAHATGEALTAQALGSASVSMGSSVVLCRPHIVFFGKSNVIGLASTVSGSGKVTRYCTATPTAGIGYTRGEASIKRASNAYYELDGFVPLATSGCVVSVPQDRIKIIATLGSFEFAECSAQANTFIRYTARSNVSGQSTAQSVNSHKILRGDVNTTAQATATITGTRVALGVVLAQADASHLAIRSRIKYAVACISDATATSIVAIGKRTANGGAIGEAGAESNFANVGTQNKSTASNQAIVTSELVLADYKGMSASFATAQAQSNTPVFGIQHKAGASDIAISTAQLVLGKYKPFGSSFVIARSQSNTPAVGNQNKATVNSTALASAGKAFAFTNSDVLAAAERYMVIDAQSRGMTVPFEDRTMTVTA